MLLDGIYSTVIMRDILERENRRGQKRVTDPILLKKITMFLADNIGNNISISSIGNTLVNEGLLDFYALLANTTLSISDSETICLGSETVTAVMQ